MTACLLLNASFEPLKRVGLDRAVQLIVDGKAVIVEAVPGKVLRSAKLTMPYPAVIRLTKFVYVPRRFRRQVTNTFLFARDGYRCGYCGKHRDELRNWNGRAQYLEREHVLPKSKGGQDTWENLVTACTRCNSTKADRTPREANMPLQDWVQLVPPKWVELQMDIRGLTAQQEQYIALFYGDDTLEQLRQIRGHHKAPRKGK